MVRWSRYLNWKFFHLTATGKSFRFVGRTVSHTDVMDTEVCGSPSGTCSGTRPQYPFPLSLMLIPSFTTFLINVLSFFSAAFSLSPRTRVIVGCLISWWFFSIGTFSIPSVLTAHSVNYFLKLGQLSFAGRKGHCIARCWWTFFVEALN